MSPRKQLELQIEHLRNDMYLAFESNESYDKMLEISQNLDRLLNDLEILCVKEKVLNKIFIRNK